jgi:hypothetical protein
MFMSGIVGAEGAALLRDILISELHQCMALSAHIYGTVYGVYGPAVPVCLRH